jgi:hypothetical protein
MTTITPSAYPASVDELVPRARARQVELGTPLSQNRIMREFRVGKDKARAVLDALAGTEVDPADRPEVQPGRMLHAVATPPPAESGPTEDAGSNTEHDPAGSGSRPDPDAHVRGSADPGTEIPPAVMTQPGRPGSVTVPQQGRSRVRSWRLTLVLLALPAFVAIWSGWVGLGLLTGFGPVHLLPGIADGFVINSAITLPIGVEAYAAFALRVWLSEASTLRARRFAKRSAIGALVLGAAGQVAYHLMSAAGITRAPWVVTTSVSCLPVVVLGCAAGLAHLIRDTDQNDGEE